MSGRLTDTELELLREIPPLGRLVDTEIEYVAGAPALGRLTDLEIEFVAPDEAPKKLSIGPGGWGFIPIGTRIDRSVYIDTYEDEY